MAFSWDKSKKRAIAKFKYRKRRKEANAKMKDVKDIDNKINRVQNG